MGYPGRWGAAGSTQTAHTALHTGLELRQLGSLSPDLPAPQAQASTHRGPEDPRTTGPGKSRPPQDASPALASDLGDP